MDFSEALLALKAGERITRPVWHADAFVTLMPGYPDGIAINATTASATRLPLGTMVRFHPYILLVEPEGCAQWVHDDDDLLAEDWMIYETSEEATAEILADPQAMADIAEAEIELDDFTLSICKPGECCGPQECGPDNFFHAAPKLLAVPLSEWRKSIAHIPEFKGGDRWRVTVTGCLRDGTDRVLYYEIEAVPELDPEVVEEVMARVGSGAMIVPGDPGYPVRPQRS